MAALSAILVMIGNFIGGQSTALFFLGIALVMNFFGYYFSDKVAIKMTRSQPVSEREVPELYAIIRSLTRKAGLPMPKVYITPSPQPNAFATGRDPEHSAVAVTEGIMRILDRDELEGVLAHEIAHIKNRDILIGSIAATLAGAITMIANVIKWSAFFGGVQSDEEEGGGIFGLFAAMAMAILAPIAALLIQMAISRSREYQADATGARLAGSSAGLANALLKLERGAQRMPMKVNPAASHLFIVNPLSGQSLAALFSTHPPIEERVSRLRKMYI